jgi:predicted DCC family thiol-disulfide oxidoreductase YuxK
MEISETGYAVNKLIVYDGQCSFCNACVSFVKSNSTSSGFSFLDFHKADDSFRQIFSSKGIKQFNSVIYFERGNMSLRSTAVLKILKGMRFPFWLLYAFIIVPAFIRDGLYHLVAVNRGKIAECKVR